MKRFYNNTIMSGALSKALRVLALLCVLLGFSGSAWGDNIKNNGAMCLKYYPGSGNDTWTNEINLNSTISIDGLSNKPYIKGAWVKTEGGTSITYVMIKIYIDNNFKAEYGVSYNGDASHWDRYWEAPFDIPFETSAGQHTIKIEAIPNSGSTGYTYINYNINGGGGGSSTTYYLKGTFNNWDASTPFSDGECTINLAASTTYQFKVHDGGNNWYGNNGDINNSIEGWTFKTDEGDCDLTTTIAGNYTFTWHEDTKKLDVTYPTGGSGDDDDTGDCKTLYLEPTTTHWNKEGARFAAYFYGGGPAETWVDMESSTCNGLFKVAVPNSAYTNVIFVRMNGATSENNWNNKWNQTNDLSLNHSNNLYTITNIGGGNQHSSGNWSTTSCDDKADCSGTGGDDEPEDCDYVEIWARGKGSYTDMNCKVSSGNPVFTDKQMYNGNQYATWRVTTKTPIAVSFCAEATYCTNAANMEPGNRYYCEFAAEGWGSQDYTITLTEPLECNNEQTAVLLSKQALVNKTAGKATLYGYLSSTNCDKQIVDYGFYYCRVIDGNKCKPTASSYKLQVSPSKELLRGEEFSAELEVEDGYTYYYRAYAKINDVDVLSAETRLISTDPCVQQVCCGEPVVYTINADPDFMENVCKLHFTSLQDAIDHLKNSASRTDAYQYVEKVGSGYNLKQPVVMNVVYYDDTPLDNTSAYIYRGTDKVGKRAGDAEPKNSNLIEDINRTATNAANTLTIKAGTSTAKPWIHHIVLRNSKNIVLDSLCIYSDPVDYDENTAGVQTIGDNAIEMDINHADGSANWHELNTRTGEGIDAGQHFFSNANILVQNCMIGSDGFTGAHISSYDGVTFKNNDFEIVAGPNIDKNYGASFKLLYCKNVKFIENNFRGDHATLMWIQEVQNMLVMNNVFWNTNKYTINEGDQYPAAMRLVTQFGNPINNVGFFYNTYYFDSNDVISSISGYDFLQMTHTISGGSGDIDIANSIKFQYNNCYSYDADAPGRTPDNKNYKYYGWKDGNYVVVADYTGPFLGYNLASNENFCPNNFWSQYDQDIYDDLTDQNKANYVSKFAFGCADNEFTNIKGEVCETTASGPASLIVKGENLNKGKKPNISFTGIGLNNEEWYSDRYLSAVRPKDDKGWTYGAYQSKGEIKTNTIYWVGTTDKWDDRNNWEYETRDASGKMVRQRVSCINTLSEDLKVIIEEIGTVEVAGGRKWPKVPASFNANDRKTESGVPVGEQVSAGESGKFASTIELEYGAGLRGVENLKDSEGKVLYDNAIVHFDADRSKWLLVGHIVKPWDEKNQEYRTGLSGDYYLQHVPQVYMHKAKLEKDDVVWDKTFADLNIPVPSNEIYAINVTEYYGTSWFSVGLYNYMYKTNYSDTEPHPYTFTGRFAVSEDNVAGDAYAYDDLSANKNLLNNVYPCNLDAKQIESLGLGTVNVYDYKKGSFVSTTATEMDGNVYIKAQNGFVFTPANDNITSLSLTDAILAEGSTRTRSTQVQLPTFSLQVDNANTTAPGASNVVVVLDEAQPANYSSPLNTPKVFTRNEDTPEAYIVSGNENCSRLYVDGDTKRIPLGIRLQKAMNITFEKVYSIDFSKVILLDAKTGKEYNLLERNYTTEKLLVSENNKDIVNRFFLVLEQEEYLPDDDVVTDVEDVVEGADINVYAVNGNAIRVVSTGVDLQSIYVSDMAGRTMKYEANGNFVELQLPVAQGVYMVHVIGDNATRTEKVVLK